MNKNVIIIPEQHLWHKSIATIPKMVQDNQEIIQEILTIVEKYDNPIVIFDGDIFHREIKMTQDAIPLLSFFIKLYSLTNGEVYSVIGNHELTYRKNNPFWSISSVNTRYYKNNIKAPLIKVVDELTVDDTLFVFGHYGESLESYKPSMNYKHAVLISHNEVVNDELLTLLKAKNDKLNDVFMHGSLAKFIPKIKDLDYVFVGHMHQAHGKFAVEENGYNFEIKYLASLGRTNHLEYTDDIQRELPVLSFNDGSLTGLTEEVITLQNRKIAVDEEKVALNKEQYDREKEVRTLRHVQSYTDDCIKGLKEIFNLNPQACVLIDSALKGEMPYEFVELLQKYGL